MEYENFYSIIIAAVRSLYNAQYVDASAYEPARLFDFIQTNLKFSSAQLLLTQISLVVCVALALFIVFVVLQRRALKTQQNAESASQPSADNFAPAGVLRGRWDAILKYLDSPREAEWKVAVIEADKLADDAMAKAGFSGDTFGDRLSNIQSGALLSLDGVWWAHKIRNRLAHESDYFLRYTEARQAIGYYEAALAELHLL